MSALQDSSRGDEALRKGSSFGFSPGGHNAFRNFGYTMYNLILLGFVGDFDPDNFDDQLHD